VNTGRDTGKDSSLDLTADQSKDNRAEREKTRRDRQSVGGLIGRGYRNEHASPPQKRSELYRPDGTAHFYNRLSCLSIRPASRHKVGASTFGAAPRNLDFVWL